jgi:magnesium transporter
MMIRKLKFEQEPKTSSITWNGLTWMDCSYPSTNETDILAQKYHFHPLALEDSLSHGQLSKVDDYGSYLLLILHFPFEVKDDQIIKPAWLSVFIGADYIITLHDHFKSLSDIFASCQTKEIREEYFSTSPGYLVYRILDRLIEDCFPILNKLLTRMDDIEDQALMRQKMIPRQLLYCGGT